MSKPTTFAESVSHYSDKGWEGVASAIAAMSDDATMMFFSPRTPQPEGGYADVMWGGSREGFLAVKVKHPATNHSYPSISIETVPFSERFTINITAAFDMLNFSVADDGAVTINAGYGNTETAVTIRKLYYLLAKMYA